MTDTPQGPRLAARLKALWANEKLRANLLVAAGVLGMLLLAFAEWLPEPKPQTETAPETTVNTARPADGDAYAAALEERLQALLEQVEGAGRTEVMVTMAAGEQTVYATDTETGADGSARQSHILLAGGPDPALVEQVTVPAVQGVAVVCEGGGSAAVQGRIIGIVAALTDVGSSHITVAPMRAAQ